MGRIPGTIQFLLMCSTIVVPTRETGIRPAHASDPVGRREPTWEPNDEESCGVLEGLYKHKASSADRWHSCRPPGRWIGLDLGAGGRGFESRHPD
jgi:hypothetical protein